MPKCIFCNKTFTTKIRLDRHLLKIKPCFINKYNGSNKLLLKEDEKKVLNDREIERGIQKVNKVSQCIFCFKKFDKLNNAKRHLDGCCSEKNERIRKYLEEEGDEGTYLSTLKREMETMQKDMSILKEKVEEYEKMKDFDEIKRSQNILLNSILAGHQNLPIIPIGKEDFNFVNKMNFRKMISIPEKAMAYMTEILNFNNKKMENWNIHQNDENNVIYYTQGPDGKKFWEIQNVNDFCEMLSTIRENQAFSLERLWENDEDLGKRIDNYNKHIEKIGQESYNQESIENLKIKLKEGLAKNELFIRQNPSLVREKFNLGNENLLFLHPIEI